MSKSVFLGLFLLVHPFSAQTSKVPEGSIRGSAVRQGTTEPVPGVQILLIPTTEPALPELRVASTESDGGGRFLIEKLTPGKYMMLIQAGDSLVPMESTLNVTVVSGQPTDVSVTLATGAVISGRIFDASGQPVPRVMVEALPANQSARSPFASLPRRSTNDRGEYRLFWLASGDYVISVTPRQSALPIENSQTQERQVRTFYPGVSDPKSAKAIRVIAGEEVQGIDLTIRSEVPAPLTPAASSTPLKISGEVVNRTAVPAPITVVLFLVSRTNVEALPKRLANVALNTPSREFEVNGVLPGSYDLYARLLDPKTERESWGRTPIEITDTDVESIRIEITEQSPGPPVAPGGIEGILFRTAP